MSESTKKLTRCAFAAAYGVIALLIGSVISVLDLSMLCLSSFGVIFAMLRYGNGRALLTYAATALLAWILLPEKLIALAYTVVTGIYPILKLRAERKTKPLLRWGIKLTYCNGVLLLWYSFGRALFGVSGEPDYPMLLLFLFGNAGFLVYDFALTQLVLIYIRKIARRIR